MRLTLLTAVVVAVTIGVPVLNADASGPRPRTGTWKGTTSQGFPISFVVGHGGPKGSYYQDWFHVKRATIKASMTCEDESVVTQTVKLIPGKAPSAPGSSPGVIADITGTSLVYRGLVASKPWAGVGVRWEGTFTSPRRVTGGTHGLNISIPDAGARGRCDSRDFGWKARWKKR